MVDEKVVSGPGHFEDDDDAIDIPSTTQESFQDISVEDVPDAMDFLKSSDFRPKLLITGAKGQLGIDLSEVLSKDFEVMRTDLEEMDITNPDDIMANFTLFEPEILVHAAAYTNVDGCESDHEGCFKVNALGTQNLAVACLEFDTRMLYVSTDYVFDGSATNPIREFQATNPVSVYGQSKLLGEQLVQSMLNMFYIVRTSWLFGPYGNNFVKTMLRLSAEREEISVVDDQWGRPTYTRDLAEAIAFLVNSPFYGVYHVSNKAETTWYKFTQKIMELAGRDTKINSITTADYPTPAVRPAYSVLDDFLWELRGFPPMRSWEDSLGDFLKHPQVVKEFPFLANTQFEP